MLRLSTTVDVMRPTVGDPTAALGKPKPGVLNRLNASTRICALVRPLNRKIRFTSDRSTLVCPGAYRMPRPTSPYVLGGGATKSAGLNQRSTVGSSSSPDPIRFGQLGAPLLTPAASVTLNGRPVVTV